MTVSSAPLVISRFESSTDAAPTRQESTWGKLVEALLRHRQSDSKTAVPLWSPAVYKNGATRGDAGVERWDLAAFDIDDGTDVETLEYWLGDHEYVIVSAHSHTPEHPKLRAVLELAEPVPVEEYDAFWRRANQHIFRGHIDPSTKDAARMLYVPSCKPGAQTVAKRHDGTPLDWRKLPPLPKAKPLKKRSSKTDTNKTEDQRRATALLAKWENELAETLTGSRHNRLLEIGRAAGGLIASELVDEQDARDRLLAASTANGSVDEDGESAVLRNIEDAIEFGRRDPWVPDDLPDSPTWLARQRFARKPDGHMVDMHGWEKVPFDEQVSTNGHVQNGHVVLEQDEPEEEPVPPFPLQVLPPVLRAFTEQAAASLSAPPDFVAVPLLVLAGATLGGAMELQIKPNWHEGPNLYGAIVGDPGSKKSPSQALAARAVWHIQRREKREYDEVQATYETDLDAWESLPKHERRVVPRPTPPAFAHLITTDVTTEALAPMLASAKGLVLSMDELVGWVKSMDQYRGGRGADRQHFLSFWNRATVKVDRKNGPPIVVTRPCLSVVGGIQPDLFPDLGDAAKREDGFLDRVLYSWPDPVPDHWTEDHVDHETIQAVEQLFTKLYYEIRGRIAADDEEPEPYVIKFSTGARALWAQWYTDFASEVESPGFPRRLRGPWAKLPSQLARLALILQATWDIENFLLSEECLAQAIELIDYFKAHARRVYAHLTKDKRDLPTTILVALQDRGEVSKGQFIHQVFKRSVPTDWITGALEELEVAGLIKREMRQGTTGRPSQVWSRV